MERSSVDVVRENLERIQETMQKACTEAGRSPEEVTLLAVTKTVDADRINRAIELGVRQIGENRVQEYLGKKEALHLDGVQAHLIGHLQTNKVKQIVGQVSMIQSVDSWKVAQAIDAASERLGISTDVLVEVNIGREEAKSGALPETLEELLGQMATLRSISVRGLMTVPPILDSEYEKRHIFSQMYRLFIDIRSKKIDNIHMDVLSMGMSSDYREAILEGTTMVRIGSSLFGKRVY